MLRFFNRGEKRGTSGFLDGKYGVPQALVTRFLFTKPSQILAFLGIWHGLYGVSASLRPVGVANMFLSGNDNISSSVVVSGDFWCSSSRIL